MSAACWSVSGRAALLNNLHCLRLKINKKLKTTNPIDSNFQIRICCSLEQINTVIPVIFPKKVFPLSPLNLTMMTPCSSARGNLVACGCSRVSPFSWVGLLKSLAYFCRREGVQGSKGSVVSVKEETTNNRVQSRYKVWSERRTVVEKENVDSGGW